MIQENGSFTSKSIIDAADSPANQMTKQGIKSSIDDFVAGYSSLAYLHAIPSSVVKVNRVFLNQTENNTVTLILSR